MRHILSFNQKEFSEFIINQLGKGKDHARLVYSAWIREHRLPRDDSAFKTAGTLLSKMEALIDWQLPTIETHIKEGDTEKLLIRLSDGSKVESVIIPMGFGKSLCVSSQVGCRMGCTFCQTGRMGLIRNLLPEEIVAQLFIAKHLLGHTIRNIVFMGMGEPFDNFDAVKQAVEIFTDPCGFALGKRHITISTSGRIDGIKRMQTEIDPAVYLAVSLNAPTQAARQALMPITRKYNLEALKKALQEYERSILIGYVLMKGINDSLEHADALADYLTGLPVKINLIPYNPQNPDPYARPPLEQIEAFANHLRGKGYRTLLRLTKGKDIMAACGQLSTG